MSKDSIGCQPVSAAQRLVVTLRYSCECDGRFPCGVAEEIEPDSISLRSAATAFTAVSVALRDVLCKRKKVRNARRFVTLRGVMLKNEL